MPEDGALPEVGQEVSLVPQLQPTIEPRTGGTNDDDYDDDDDDDDRRAALLSFRRGEQRCKIEVGTTMTWMQGRNPRVTSRQ